MDRPPGSRLEKILTDFAEQHGVLNRAQEQMRALSVTACSKDGVVEVTVGADGRAAGVHFVSRRFRELAAPQLGDSVLEALTTARAEFAARATAVLTAANIRLPVAAEGAGEGEPRSPEAIREAPSVCWRRLVGEARAVTVGPVPVNDSAWARPLWGRRPGTRSTSPHTPLPAELREAVTALRDAVCDAVCGSRDASTPAGRR
ncbi:YbaB/EbfC family nucleoid-associated protein [Streptomyces sp. NRRL WC-3725]|uniref:YbaB/EbfC family nucleoid-associated protein n=1 Tax=Streptomyces sp. NRRL WC-3725 TaxID=1463933 RepID=UPI0004C79729|nr:YbaB/EbfC family nucleoid-associated protein [Streptomyces sp. NRRL WC-3725]